MTEFKENLELVQSFQQFGGSWRFQINLLSKWTSSCLKLNGNALYLFQMNGQHNWRATYSPGYERFSTVSKGERRTEAQYFKCKKKNSASKCSSNHSLKLFLKDKFFSLTQRSLQTAMKSSKHLYCSCAVLLLETSRMLFQK